MSWLNKKQRASQLTITKNVQITYMVTIHIYLWHIYNLLKGDYFPRYVSYALLVLGCINNWALINNKFNIAKNYGLKLFGWIRLSIHVMIFFVRTNVKKLHRYIPFTIENLAWMKPKCLMSSFLRLPMTLGNYSCVYFFIILFMWYEDTHFVSDTFWFKIVQ